MKRRISGATGLEGAPDIMLLTMAALMVAIVWLVSHAAEATLPPLELPTSQASRLGAGDGTAANVSLRPRVDGDVEVFLEDVPLPDGLAALADALRASGAADVTLRADAATPWQATLDAMTAASEAGLNIRVAANR